MSESRTYATADIIVVQGSSVISFSINNSGYRYGVGEKLTISSGGTLGIPTTSDFKAEFNFNK